LHMCAKGYKSCMCARGIRLVCVLGAYVLHMCARGISLVFVC
jgi:hypothetical protein